MKQEKRTVPILVQSKNGHDTLNVQPEKVEEEVKKQLVNGNWVTIEKTDGTSETLTKKDLPEDDEVDKKLAEEIKQAKEPIKDWKNVFGGRSPSSSKIEDDDAEDEPIAKTTSTTAKKQFSKKFEKVRSATSVKAAKGG